MNEEARAVRKVVCNLTKDLTWPDLLERTQSNTII